MRGTRFLFALLCAGAAVSNVSAEEKRLTIKGSDTMVHLVSRWAEDFMTKHPDVDVSVTGGGSGTGIAALLNKTTEIAASSRDMEQKEKDQGKASGVAFAEHKVAADGIAIIVNPSNPVSELTLAQLSDIYTGKVTNWKDVGGKDLPIVALSRESSSGTFVFFQEHVLKKKDYSPSTRLMPATSAIVQGAVGDAGAIGYVGLGYAKEAGATVKVVQIRKEAGSPLVSPSEETVLNGSYPIARPLYFYTVEQLAGPGKEFIEFALSAEGQKAVVDAGFVPLKANS